MYKRNRVKRFRYWKQREYRTAHIVINSHARRHSKWSRFDHERMYHATARATGWGVWSHGEATPARWSTYRASRSRRQPWRDTLPMTGYYARRPCVRDWKGD